MCGMQHRATPPSSSRSGATEEMRSLAPPLPTCKDRQLQIRAQAEKWLASARHSGLIIPAKPQADSQHQGSSSGVSIDWLRNFSESLKELPLLPTETYSVVRDIVNFSTSDAACRLIDVIPQEHVGYPSYYICHNWNGDFHNMVSALVADFSKRWQAHLAYKVSKTQDFKMPKDDEDSQEDAGTAAMLTQERKKLAGYYVWIDIAAINQHQHSQLDTSAVSRLISVIGRTVLMLDESAAVLTRLWCCYELWTTIKAQRNIFVIHVASDTSADTASESDSDEAHPDDVAEKLAVPDLATAKASMPVDKTSILASLQQDLQSPKIKVKTLEDIGRELQRAVANAIVREQQQPKLLKRVYTALSQCCKAYTDSDAQPGYTQVDSVRKALRELISLHYRKEASRSKLLPQEDPELETWECLAFLEKEFERQRADDFWLQDIKRFNKLTLHSYATRFSNGYVNNLMRQAGTHDDMKALSQFVHSRCRTKTIEKWGSSS